MKKRGSRPAMRVRRSTRSTRTSRPRTVRRSVTPTRARQSSVRRQAIRTSARSTRRVRPAVRPAAAPRKVMPARRAPARLRSVAAGAGRRAARVAPQRGLAPRPGQAPASRTVRRRRKAVRPSAPPVAAPARRAARKAQSPAARPGRAAALGGAAAVTAAAFALNLSAAHPSLAPELSSLQFSLSNLENSSNFDDLAADLQRLDNDLRHALDLLESARDKGYRYQKDLDDLAVQTAGSWESIYNQALAEVEQQGAAFQAALAPLSTQVPQLNAHLNSPSAASPYLRSTATTVNGLLQDVNARRSQIKSSFAEVESNTYKLTLRLTTIHWVLSQLDEARFSLEKGENIVGAVKTRWDQGGKNDPEGILFLTNRRLIFERKEKVATKKVLFITTEKELVHEVLFAEKAGEIKSNTAQSKGLFGHQDYLEVVFGGKLGTLSLHLDGQDSSDWSVLIDKVKSGKIEDEMAVEGGLSFADLSGELTQADIIAVQNEVNGLQDELLLSEPRAELESLENEVRELERDLADLRARGYAIEKDLEGDITVLSTQWDRVKGNAEKALGIQAGILADQSKTISDLMGRLAGMSGNLPGARPVYMQLKSSIASAEAQAGAALETVYGQFDDYAEEVEGLAAHLDWVDWMLDAISTASFKLLATESGVAATEAMYARPGMDAENGILYLTDQRLIWEDRVGDYEVKVDIPLSQIEDVSVDTREEDGEPDEFLVFKFSASAPIHESRFDIAAPVGEDWLQMAGRARSGDYTSDRAIKLDEGELERIRNAPTQCPNCGAQFTAPILRGQTEITCEFCGVTTRV